MKWLWNFVSVSLVLVVSVLTGPTAKAGTTIMQNTCPIIIPVSGEYDLGTDVNCPAGDGITILASSVTLHLDSHTINGNCSGIGIHVLGTPLVPLTQVRILGSATLSGFQMGLSADYSSGSFAKFVTVESQCFENYGFLIRATSSQWKLDGNVVRAPSTSFGMVINGDDNDLVRNNVNDTISVNGKNNVVVGNTANDNTGGLFVTGSNNEIHANTTKNNSDSYGILLVSGASMNNISGNKSFDNTPFDMEDDNPNCGTNKWRGNHFGKANQKCIRSGKDDDREDEDRKDDDRKDDN